MALTTLPTAAFSEGSMENFRNLIINGDMSLAQRGTSATGLTNGSGGYQTVDRFRFEEGGSPTAQFTMTQSTDVPTGQGFGYSTKFDCTTAQGSLASGDIIRFGTFLEGQNLQQLKKGTSSAESLTLSFWVKSNKTGTYTMRLEDQDNSRMICASYTISASATWEKKTITFAGDTTGALDNDNGLSFIVRFNLLAGTNYDTGTLQTTWGSRTDANSAVGQVNLADSTSNEWYITGVQLEVGTSASDFEFLPYDVNLLRCQRYYQRIQGNASDQVAVGNGFAIGITQVRTYLQLFTTMRVAPTLGENLVECLYGSSFSAAISLSLTLDEDINTYGITFTADTGSPFTQNDPVFVRLENSTSAFIEFGAEL